MNTRTSVERILNRGIIKQILPSEDAFREALLSGKPLRFYIGADPTGPSLHLSHAKNFMLLEEFRRLGHKVFVLFGDLTACIGDPTDRSSARARLTRDEAKRNVDSWVGQIRSIIDFDDCKNPAEVVLNSTWFDRMSIVELVELLSSTTVQRMLERDMFEKRMEQNRPIYMHEFVYPLFQGYDSVALDIDVELCGTDQIFNALAGRDLVRRYRNKEKFVVAVNLMENPITGALMSKSNGTGVFLGTDANTMFGAIMSLPDEMIEVVLINNTRISINDIKALDISNNPRHAKLVAAKEVVRIFYGAAAATEAESNFISTFSERSFPEDAPVVEVMKEEIRLLDLMVLCEPDKSKSDLRRLLQQGAVAVDGKRLLEAEAVVAIASSVEVKIGKRGFFRVRRTE